MRTTCAASRSPFLPPRLRPALAGAALFASAACSDDGGAGGGGGGSAQGGAAEGEGKGEGEGEGDVGAAGGAGDANDPAWGPRGDCNPVDPSHCLLPYPSRFFQRPDATAASGWRLDFGPGSLPADDGGTAWDPARWNRRDGFPTLGSLYARFPNADLAGVVGLSDIGAHAAADARTVIVEADTGARLPHFVELDQDAAGTDRQLLILRPATPMRHGARYVVGIRGLVGAGGGEAFPAPAGFANLRDGGPDDDRDLARQRRRYEAEVFPVLGAAGFPRPDLQLAWDFVTASLQGVTGDAAYLRTLAVATTPERGPAYVIDAVEPADCAAEGVLVGRTVRLHFTAPSFVSPPGPGGMFVLDPATGLPTRAGDRQVAMTVRIPCSVLSDPAAGPGRLVQYGHGLLGGQLEIEDVYLGELADAHRFVLFGIDWTGMSRDDVGEILAMMSTDRSRFAIIPDRLDQAYVEGLLATRLMRGALAADAALRSDGDLPLVDTAEVVFYGNSQGAVVGGGYVAFHPDIARAVLGVGGTPFMFLATRAVGFDAFRSLLQTLYAGDLASATLALPVMQILWDSGESAGWVHAMDKPLLLHAAVGDRAVTSFGAHILARAVGASLVAPATRPVWGLTERPPPFSGNALVEMDWGIPDMELATSQAAAIHTHGLLRTTAESRRQVARFLETGEVIHTCAGRCVFAPPGSE